MRFPAALLLGGMLVGPALRAENAPISGYVTRVSCASDFDVNGIRIRCSDKTKFSTVRNGAFYSGAPGCPRSAPYVGESATVKGAFDKQDHSLIAKEIDLTPESGSSGRVSGSAVISEVHYSHSGSPAAGSLLVRADGYRILITGKALIVWVPPLHSLAGVKPGDWIDYEGQLRSDGTVISNKVRLAPLVVGKGEERYRSRRDFDPSKVPTSAKQSAASMYFWGVNPKRLPPYQDAEMQARVNKIGDKLIPVWQRMLPDSNPVEIRFRFQLISTRKFRDGLALSSGVIFVPQQVVSRMQNDSQLAAVLADNIAVVLEREDYRHLSPRRELTAAQWGTEAAGFFVPDADLVNPWLGIGGHKVLIIKEEEQSGRVALGLLHDAGYDIDQAPVAWWLLGSNKPKPIAEIPLPRRAAYLYRILGECWNNPHAVADRR